MSEKKEKPKEDKKTGKQKKTRKRKWSLGKLVPIEMPENPIMKEIDEEIQAISEREALYLKTKTRKANRLFTGIIVSSLLSLGIWMLVGLLPFVKDPAAFRAALSLFEGFFLYFLLKLFEIYAEKGVWKTRRKKSIVIWMMVLFFILSFVSLVIKF